MEGASGQGRAVVVIGDGDLTDETARALEASGADVNCLIEPDEEQVRAALSEASADAVAVVGRADALVLRWALMVRDVTEDVPLLLTIFDPTMAQIVARELPNTHVTSMADIVAPSLAGPCIDERFTAVTVTRRPRRRPGGGWGGGARGGAAGLSPAPPGGAHARALHALRQERRPAAVRGDRPGGDLLGGDDHRGLRARRVGGRRDLRLGQDARDRRPQSGGRRTDRTGTSCSPPPRC